MNTGKIICVLLGCLAGGILGTYGPMAFAAGALWAIAAGVYTMLGERT